MFVTVHVMTSWLGSVNAVGISTWFVVETVAPAPLVHSHDGRYPGGPVSPNDERAALHVPVGDGGSAVNARDRAPVDRAGIVPRTARL